MGEANSVGAARRRSLGAYAGGLIRFFVFGNIFLALGAALWAYSTYHVLRVARGPANGWLLVFVAAGVVVVYTVDRVFTFGRPVAPEAASNRHLWIERRRPALLALLVASAVVTIASLPFLHARVVVAALVGGVVALAYSLPVRKNFTAGLKDFGLLKVFLIAAVWAVVTAVLPPLDMGASVFDRDVALLAAERFLFVFAITLPFDVRDAPLDRASGIRTIPVRVGTRASKALVLVAVAAYLGLKVAHYGVGSTDALVPAVASAAYVVVLLARLTEDRNDYYFSLLWDGAIFVQALLALLFVRHA